MFTDSLVHGNYKHTPVLNHGKRFSFAYVSDVIHDRLTDQSFLNVTIYFSHNCYRLTGFLYFNAK